MDLKSVFDRHDDEFLQFDRVADKRSRRPDLHAFLLLDSLLPSDRDMVCGAEHDKIFLETDPDELAKVVTEEQVLELVRCGVRFHGDDGLTMYV